MTEGYVILMEPSLEALESRINRQLTGEWILLGSPFLRPAGGTKQEMWCQSVYRALSTTKPGEVKLKEPKK